MNRIGNIDVSSIFTIKLTFKVGNGSDGGWPLCGSVSKWMGYEAIHAWRSVHGRTQWLVEIDAADKSHEAMLIRIKEEERQKRIKAKSNKAPKPSSGKPAPPHK